MPAQNAHSFAPRRAELKVCGDCTLCCKVYDVADFDKKAGKPCHNLRDGVGCGLWGLHPKSCQEFKCLWLKHDDMGPLWRPDVAGFVLRLEGKTLYVDIDQARPQAWRREVYYKQLKLWSDVILHGAGMVIINEGAHIIVLTPDEELSLRPLKRGEVIETSVEMSLFGPRLNLQIVAAKDNQKTDRRLRA
jgi:hypothetical protein